MSTDATNAGSSDLLEQIRTGYAFEGASLVLGAAVEGGEAHADLPVGLPLSRAVLAEPLVQGTTWNSVGGSTNDVTATNRYRGVVDISVPAFPTPVKAAKIESVIKDRRHRRQGRRPGPTIKGMGGVLGQSSDWETIEGHLLSVPATGYNVRSRTITGIRGGIDSSLSACVVGPVPVRVAR